MESLRNLYRIGPGPSSSHSLGVRNACEYYYGLYPEYDEYRVELYGSLALTGKGHMSDKVIYNYFKPKKVTVVFIHEMTPQPNTLKFYCLKDGQLFNEETIYSVGGGAIEVEGRPAIVDQNVYPEKSLTGIIRLCEERNLTLADYVFLREPDIGEHLQKVLDKMLEVVRNGLKQTGYLPGELHLEKIAGRIYDAAMKCEGESEKKKLLLSSYAYAAMEESSSGSEVVTSPTLGASGIVSSLVTYYHEAGYSDDELIKGLAVAGLIGNLVKTNASISGATGGCQAEIGTACAMGAALASTLEHLSNHQIEYAAEVAMEHNLGLTCDPVGGYVQIPCIERNGVGVLRAVDAMDYARYLGVIKKNRVSFDMVVNVMKHTGRQLPVELKETSLGGLALEIKPGQRHDI